MQVLGCEDVNALVAQQVIIDLRSLIKELLENALDSGATLVYLRSCGTDYVQVTDNGRGIPPSDFPKLACRGATSKLDSFEGLRNIVAKGFRGEALFSIAQTCCLEITTKTALEETATRLTYKGGKLLSQELSTADTGTTVKVTDLFANLPVRRQDLAKTFKSQLSKTVQLVQAYALLEDTIRITFVSEGEGGQLLVEGMPNEPLRVRAAQFFGLELETALQDVDFPLGEHTKLTGVLLSPSRLHQPISRDMQLFYINRRHVYIPPAFKSALRNITKAFGLRNPIYALHLQIPPEQLDINLTPDKMEVRVLQEKALAGKVYTALQEFYQAGKQMESLPVLKRKLADSPVLGNEKRVKLERQEPQHLTAVITQLALTQGLPTKPHTAQSKSQTCTPPSPALPSTEIDKLDFLQRYFVQLKVIGQFNEGFIVTRLAPHSLFIIDQHAADEKANFESLMKTTEIHTQPLVVPQTLRLPVADQALVTQHLQTFANIGFHIEVRQDNSFHLLTKPLSKWTVFDTSDLYESIAHLKNVQFATDREQVAALIRPKKYRDMFASRACRSSVMIGTTLTTAKMREIVNNLATLDRPWTCPHGRPTIRHLFNLENCLARQYRPPQLANLP